MTPSALFQYTLPALLVGAVGGFFAGNTLAGASNGKEGRSPSTLRADFLSSADDDFDYEKLARVCLSVANRATPGVQSHGSELAKSNSPEVIKMKDRLDDVLSTALEDRKWSRGAGMVASNILRRIPPSDAADFEKLLRTTLERGDMEVQPGAWIPKDLN